MALLLTLLRVLYWMADCAVYITYWLHKSLHFMKDMTSVETDFLDNT